MPDVQRMIEHQQAVAEFWMWAAILAAVALWVATVILGFVIGKRRDDEELGFWLGLVCGPVGLLVLCLLPPRRPDVESESGDPYKPPLPGPDPNLIPGPDSEHDTEGWHSR